MTSIQNDATIQMLHDLGQDHLFNDWSTLDISIKERFLKQLSELHQVYPLNEYIHRAKVLLNSRQTSEKSLNVPDRIVSVTTLHDIQGYENKTKLDDAAFVLVAGGLGERLGYSGIKISLPTEITTEVCYLQYYIHHILAMSSGKPLPLVIMTSQETDATTRELLRVNHNFGMSSDQITILVQDNVPALLDTSARLCLTDHNNDISVNHNTSEISSRLLLRKPHGHGDVHALLFRSGIVKQWTLENRVKYIIFFQDTNALIFKGIPAALGVSVHHKWDINILTVTRTPGDAMGAIAYDKSIEKTINVEYNELAKSETVANCKEFPGNTNAIIVKVDSYCQTLERTQGRVPEFINPKYNSHIGDGGTAKQKTFKTPARLECLMQDILKVVDAATIVGCTRFERSFIFSPVKNNIQDALVKQRAGLAPESALSAELDLYRVNCQLLEPMVQFTTSTTYVSQNFEFPKIVWSPYWATTLSQIRSHFTNEFSNTNVRISSRSTLVLNGAKIDLQNLTLDGALVIHAVAGAHVIINGLNVQNQGWNFELTTNSSTNEKYQIRGYTLCKNATTELNFKNPGEYVLNDSCVHLYVCVTEVNK